MNKAAIIERAIRRWREEYASDPEFRSFTHIDALTLNIERACQAAIDLSMHLVARERLGMPQNSADAFRMLARAGQLKSSTAQAMIAMTGFGNIAIHAYQEMDMGVLRHIAEEGHRSLILLCQELGLLIRP
jgi:uncharacterized protein YutE (UPF0331/DUF86 family)